MTLDDAWRDFAKTSAVPTPTSDHAADWVTTLVRRAFYAGALAMVMRSSDRMRDDVRELTQEIFTP